MSKKYDFSAFDAPKQDYDFSAFDADRQPAAAKEEKSTLQDIAETGYDALLGGAQGASMGTIDEIEAALRTGGQVVTGKTSLENIMDAYRQNKDAVQAVYKESEERSPVATGIGQLAGGAASAYATAGLLPAAVGVGTLAKAAPAVGRLAMAAPKAEAMLAAKAALQPTTLAKMAAAGKQGVILGGIGGYGVSDEATVGADIENALEGAAIGGVFGGVTEGAIGAAKSLGKTSKEVGKAIGNTRLVQDGTSAYELGKEGTEIITAKGLDAAEEGTRKAGKTLAKEARGSLKSAGVELGEAKKLAKERGFTVDSKEGIDKIKSFIETAKTSIDDLDREDAKVLQKLVKNLEEGVEQPVNVQYSKIKPGKEIIAKSSSREILENEAAKAQASAKALGQDLRTEIVESTDEQGRKILTLVKSSDEQIGGAERAVVTPENEALGIASSEKAYKTNRNEKGEVIGYSKLDDADSAFSNQLDPSENFKSTASAKSVLNQEAIPPGQFTATERGPLINETQNVRLGGQDPASLPFEEADKLKGVLNNQTGAAGNTPTLKTNKGINLVKQVASGIDDELRTFDPVKVANDKYASISQAFDVLGLDPKTAFKGGELTVEAQQKLTNTIKRMARDTDAGDNASVRLDSALNLLKRADPKLAEKLAPQIQKASKTLDLAQKAQRLGLLNKSTYVKSGTIMASNVAGLAARKIGKVFGKANNQELKQVAQELTKQGPKGMKAASALAEVMRTEGVQRNAAIFSLQQNPEYRAILKDYFEDEDKKD